MYQPKYPKTNFRNPKNTTIPILETQIIGKERAHLPSTRPRLARRSLGSHGLGSPLGSSLLMFWVSFYKGYKSSLRDSIFMWSPCGKNATSDMIRPWKSKSLRLDLQTKIESHRLEMLINNIVWEPKLLTIQLENYAQLPIFAIFFYSLNMGQITFSFQFIYYFYLKLVLFFQIFPPWWLG